MLFFTINFFSLPLPILEIFGEIVDKTFELFDIKFNFRNKYCVALIHGPKGCGKSMISLLLGKKITKKDQEVHFCDTFKLTDPGDQFSNLYNLIE